VREARASAKGGQAACEIVALAERCLDILGLPPSAAAAGLEARAKDAALSTEQRATLAALAGDGEMEDAALIDRVVALRDEARAGKDFVTSDRLRDALQSAGVALRDTKNGTQWSLDAGR